MDVEKYLIELEQLMKEQDSIYHNAAVKFGLSDTSMWILYHVTGDKSEYTQQELCRECCFPKQTVNTAIKNLVSDGYAELEEISGNRKSKRIRLTERGKQLAAVSTDKIKQIEFGAYGRFGIEELNFYLDMTRKLNDNLRELSDKILKENENE